MDDSPAADRSPFDQAVAAVPMDYGNADEDGRLLMDSLANIDSIDQSISLNRSPSLANSSHVVAVNQSADDAKDESSAADAPTELTTFGAEGPRVSDSFATYDCLVRATQTYGNSLGFEVVSKPKGYRSVTTIVDGVASVEKIPLNGHFLCWCHKEPTAKAPSKPSPKSSWSSWKHVQSFRREV